MDRILTFFASYVNVFKINDLLDILFVALAIYWLIKLIAETRAAQLVKGLIVLLVVTQVSDWFNLNVINFILTNVMQVGFLALIIVFQPELRRALEQAGRTRLGDFIFASDSGNKQIMEQTIVEICAAAGTLSSTKTGGLIVIERNTKIGDVMLTGTPLESKVTKELILNIFYPNTPLHDGAIVISDNKIKAAGCLLPLCESKTLSSELGTRHRAALGMSETSDALVVVVSEETGKISVAKDGSLTRNYTPETLKRSLEKNLIISVNNKKSPIRKIRERVKDRQ